jgi:hypothetical protein
MEPEQKEIESEIQKELKTRFSLLPEDLQNTINSSDYQMKLFEIAKKYKLTYEQLGTLELETTMVLLGMTDPRTYQRELSANINKKTEDLALIIKEVEEQVFGPIRESLKNLYETEEEEVEEDLGPPAMTEGPRLKTQDLRDKTGGNLKQPEAKTAPVTESKSQGMAVPKAPYAKTQVSASSFQVSGNTGERVQDTRSQVLGNTGGQTTDLRDKTKDSSTVQNADAKPVGNIVADKLKETWTVPSTKTDYTIKKMGDTQSSGMDKSSDPYREPIG